MKFSFLGSFWLSILLSIFSLHPASGQNDPSMAKANYILAEKAYNENDPESALKYLDLAIVNLGETKPRIEYLKAKIHYRKGERQEVNLNKYLSYLKASRSLYTYFMDAKGSDFGFTELVEIKYNVDKYLVNYFYNNKRLIEAGYKRSNPGFYKKGGKNHSPIVRAAIEGNFSAIDFLLRNGVSVNDTSRGVSPLIASCFGKGNYLEKLPLVRYLVEKGADINLIGTAPNRSDFIALSTACIYNHFEIVKFLVSKGANINIELSEGLSPLATVCLRGNQKIAQFLIQNGADVNMTSGASTKYSPLTYLAATRGEYFSFPLIQYLVNKGANINGSETYFDLPLHSALASENFDVADYLLSKGASLKFKDEYGASTAHYICQFGSFKAVAYLYDKGKDIKAKDDKGTSTLAYAAYSNNIDVMKQLIKAHGMDINEKNDAGETPLHKVFAEGHNYKGFYAKALKTTEYMLSAGADTKAKNNKGETPLDYLKKYCGDGESLSEFDAREKVIKLLGG